MSTQLKSKPETATRGARTPDRLYSAIIGLTSLLILLQCLWAGLFIREGEAFDASAAQAHWVEVHDLGARAAIVLAATSFIVARWRLSTRKDLVVGTGLLTLLLVLEAYIGGEIGDRTNWSTIHIPLGMALMALSVWLPIRAVHRHRSTPQSADNPAQRG